MVIGKMFKIWQEYYSQYHNYSNIQISNTQSICDSLLSVKHKTTDKEIVIEALFRKPIHVKFQKTITDHFSLEAQYYYK